MNVALRLKAVRIEAGPLATPCHIWTRALTKDGYGRIWAGGRGRLTHRVAYELHVGPIPAGLTLDHLCRNRACCNPAHVEPVTQRVNLSRSVHPNTAKDACIRGHAFDEENTYQRPSGGRACRTCLRDRWRALHQVAS